MERGVVPVGLYSGVLRPIPTLERTGTAVYGTDDMPDEFAYVVAKELDEQHRLQWEHLSFSYNVQNVWRAYEDTLRLVAARYHK